MTSPGLAVAAVLAVGAVVALGGTAHAQDASAEVLFRDGDRLMGEGKLAEACVAFEASNRIEARAGTLIRLGDCREKNQQLASAWSAYVDALSRAKDPGKKNVATAKVRSLEARLSRWTITIAAPTPGLTITRGDVVIDRALWGRAIPIDGGTYTLHATAVGFAPWQATVQVPIESGAVTIEVPALVELPPTEPTSDPTTDRTDRSDRPIGSVERPRGLSGRRKAAIGLGATGAVVTGVAIVLGLQARALEADAARICPDVMCLRAGEANAALDRASTRARLANVGYGVGGAAIATGAILWLLGGSSDRGRGVALVPTRGGAAVVGHF